MQRLVVFLCLMIFSLSAWCNEVVQIRSTVQSQKTRVVFDLLDKPKYQLTKVAPYKVALDISQIENTKSLPHINKSLGKIIDRVEVSSTGSNARYLFVLKWDVAPLLGELKPQVNYKHHRVYLDFLNSRIDGDSRSQYEQKLKGAKEDQSIGAQSVDQHGASTAGELIVLTPEEAQKRKNDLSKENQLNMEKISQRKAEEARRKAEEAKLKAEAKRKAEAEAKLKAEAKRKAEAEAKLKAEAKRKAEAEAKKAEAKRKAEEDAKLKAEAKRKAEEDAKLKAEAKRKAEEERKAQQNARKNDNDDKISGRCHKRKIIIAIDPGHGGKDPGAIGVSGIKEKNITLSISRRLAKLINGTSDLKAVMVRNKDVFIDLNERSEKARKANADILISIHADASSNNTAKGASVLVLNNNRAARENQKVVNTSSKHDSLLGGASEVLGETAAIGENNEYMKNMIIDLTSGKSRDAGYDLANRIIKYLSKFARMHKSKPDERSLAVLKAPDIPSILVETGFVSNPVEAKLLNSANYQKKVAKAIFDSIEEHLDDPRYKVDSCR